MSNAPLSAEYHYQGSYYKLGEYYALYYLPEKHVWRYSATVTNRELVSNAVEING